MEHKGVKSSLILLIYRSIKWQVQTLPLQQTSLRVLLTG